MFNHAEYDQKNSSIIYLDLPVGTGFSYAKTSQDHKSGDHEQVQHSLQFLKKVYIHTYLPSPFSCYFFS